MVGACKVCENASKPSGFLMVKIGEMEPLVVEADLVCDVR